MKKYIYGIDIGGTTVKIGIFNLVGELLEKWEIKTNKDDLGSQILGDIFNAIKKHHINLDDVLGYGFGVPGPVVDGFVIEAVNLGWKDIKLKAIFSDLTNNNNIFVENDANVAVLGETTQGAAKGHVNSAMLTVGTGVGGGFVINGKVVDGVNGSAGEIGHLRVIHENGRLCNCGNKGCLETVASATGIKAVFVEMFETSNFTSELVNDKYLSVKMIFDAAKRGDSLSLAVVDKITCYLSYACSIISVTTNPSVIIIGGGVSNAGSFLIDKIKKHFIKIAFEPVKETLIVKAKLGNDAGIYGAASLVIDD